MRSHIFKKVLALSLLGGALTLSSCSGIEDETESFIEQLATPIDDSSSVDINSTESFTTEESTIEESEEVLEESSEEIIEFDEDSLEYNSREQDIIEAIDSSDIFDKDGKKIGRFAKNTSFVYLGELDDKYIIDYYGEDGYVTKEGMKKTTKRVIDMDMISKGYVPKGSFIYDSKELVNPLMELESLEFVEIYKEFDDSYLVQTIDIAGFVPKDKVEILEGDLFVTDKSNQEGRFYEGNQLYICMPIVTGTKNTGRDTPLGLFKVHTKAKGYFDIQPGYKVKCVMYYDSNRGIHTAEWRDIFGGDIWESNGSHGCTNCPEVPVLEVYEKLDKGEKVLVKY